MKEGWEYKKLGEVCRIERGGSPRPIKDFITNSPEGLNWIKIGDTDPQGKYIYSTKEKIKPEGLRKSRWVEVDEFLLSNSMSFGRPYILKTNGCIHDGWLVLRDYQNSLIIDYFYYLLISPHVQNQFRTKAQGSTVSNLNTDRVADVSIAFPPLSEQQSIVDYLDSAFAKIDAMKANAEKALNEAKALFQASLKEMLEPKEGWVTSTLKDECYKITDGTHQTPKYYPSGYIFLSSRNVTSRKIDWEDVKFIDESQHQLMYKRVAPQVGDILLAKNGTTGVAAMVDRDVVFDIYVSLALLRSRGNVTPEYLLAFVNSPIAKEQFDKRLIGMGVPNLHLGEINQVVITYPQDKVEQIRMTQRIEELDSLIIRLQANYDKISQECDALKQAILRQVFE